MKKSLFLGLVLILMSSCAQQVHQQEGKLPQLLQCKPQIIMQKCKIPTVPEVKLQPIDPNQPSNILMKQLVNQWYNLYIENQELRKAIKLCQ